MICYPNAKINLGLNVTERRPDGYHNLETVFYPIPLCDVLSVQDIERKNETDHFFPNGCTIVTQATDDYVLKTGGIDINCPAEKNLIIKVLRQLKEDFEIPPVHIDMLKQIPSGAGLGGGSSDAAFMMKTLNNIFRLGLSDEDMERRLSGLGADCAFFVCNQPVFATGIGNIFSPCSLSLKGWTLILVKPDIFVSTKEAYAGITPHYPDRCATDTTQCPVDEWKDTLTNDFEEGIFNLYPAISDIKSRLYRMGASYASMSGSGSSVFGLFKTPLDITLLQKEFAKHFYWQHTL